MISILTSRWDFFIRTLFLLVPLGFAWSAAAQIVPRFNYLVLNRELFVETFPGEKFENTWTDQGTISRTEIATTESAWGSGYIDGWHSSVVTDLGISASLELSYEGTAGESSFAYRGSSGFTASFTVSHRMAVSWTVTLKMTGTGGLDVDGGWSIGPTFEFGDAYLNVDPECISGLATLEPGTIYTTSVFAKVNQGVFNTTDEGTVTVDVTMASGTEDGCSGNGGGGGGGGTGTGFGDLDSDGLPDIWESNGINVGGDDDIEIDLPSLGVLPGRKDVIVEVDVQSGSTFPLDVLSDVVNAFANAPVMNPDGSQGITLHLLVDETDLPPLTYPDSGLRDVVAIQKSNYFGTPEERNDPDWNAIRAAKLLSMRYAVIGGQRANGSSGWGEVLGDDFIVTLENFSDLNPNDYAGTFMHELGHNLGLRHGGADTLQYKPNYLSVMSYLFQMEKQTSDRIPWALDYSHEQLATLDESETLETEGFGPTGPTGGLRFTVYNAGAPGFSPIPQGIEVLADEPVDFNFNGVIDPGPTILDLNRIAEDVDPTPDQVLRGHNDWANLSLAFNTSGNFGDGVGAGSGSADELDLQDLAMLTEVFANLPDITSNDGDGSEAIPGRYRLDQNYPNPFNPSTTISYSLPRAGHVSLSVYDVLGRQLRVLASGPRAAGTHEVTFDATDLPSGVYLYRLRAGDHMETRRMVVVR